MSSHEKLVDQLKKLFDDTMKLLESNPTHYANIESAVHTTTSEILTIVDAFENKLHDEHNIIEIETNVMHKDPKGGAWYYGNPQDNKKEKLVKHEKTGAPVYVPVETDDDDDADESISAITYY